MGFKHLLILAACSWSTLGFPLEPRAENPLVTGNIEDLPTACRSTCDSVFGLLSDISSSSLPTLCTTEAVTAVNQCFDCLQTNAPELFTPETIEYIQGFSDEIGPACTQIGSPIPSVVVPSATGSLSLSSTSGSGSGSSSAPSITPTTTSTITDPGSSQTASSSGTISRPNASGRKFEVIGLSGTVGLIMLSMSILA
ncbi:hypothetical protein M408DRAFT_28246 [Serendipita vermifera MAFF 305830]|uniref:Extracellular membrane protein CFEM domain-containing protein n=1 Tax=Serendipita vermifera MAFF 305830 TaxID=933852 RepID=A0A0C3AUR8_SERVB|nr:hypothetical protein M408DRAFT_28246 [Serendipita vermifera MAFF 305830]